jgi:BASS family bile acid:Na+ symporter
MDLKTIILLVLQVSILSTVFGFGLKATSSDLLYLWRRPGLLVRSILAVFVLMPLLTVLLVRAFDFPPVVKVILVALAVSPVPPILPNRESGAGGHASYGLGLMATLSLLSIAAIPLVLAVVEQVFDRDVAMAPIEIAKVIVSGALAPLLAGMAIRGAWPAFAERIAKPVTLVGRVLLPVGVLALVIGALPAIWAATGDGTVLAMVFVTIAGLAVGHVLGGPDPDHAVVLALSTACRHPAIALTLATANAPHFRFGGIILLYLIVSTIVGLPYLKWQQQRLAGQPSRAS